MAHSFWCRKLGVKHQSSWGLWWRCVLCILAYLACLVTAMIIQWNGQMLQKIVLTLTGMGSLASWQQHRTRSCSRLRWSRLSSVRILWREMMYQDSKGFWHKRSAHERSGKPYFDDCDAHPCSNLNKVVIVGWCLVYIVFLSACAQVFPSKLDPWASQPNPE